MHAVVREYSGVSALMDEMETRQNEVEEILGAVSGFTAYYAVRDGDKLTTITVCQDEAGTAESTGRAAEWVRDNMPEMSASPPQVREGNVFLSFAAH